jgi:diguanylate cyclase (GGDEF)-like protein
MQPRDEVQVLNAQVKDATTAASNAYRDTSRLIRLLTVLSSLSAPDELLGKTLRVISETFTADVVCVTWLVDGRHLVLSASGVPDDDPSFVDSWPAGPAATEAVQRRKAVSTDIDPAGDDVPPSLIDLGLRSAAFVPMSDSDDESVELLVLYRSSGETFSGTDLHVLVSVAERLRVAAEDRERAVAIERLAQTGHMIARHLDSDSLVDQSVGLLHDLTAADSSSILAVSNGRVRLWRHRGSSEPAATNANRPVEDLPAWTSAMQGRPWIGTDSDSTVLCVPVMREGAPVALLYAVRSRPFRSEIIEITTIFASYVGAALENAGLYRELRTRATRDPLTGLANRDLASQRLDDVLSSGSSLVGLLFCDLDGFKAVNDRLGHEAGDELLQLVADRLRKDLRATDLLARFGGDEFVMILGEVESLCDVKDIGRRLLFALHEPFTLEGERVTVTASIGGVLGVRGETTSSAMLRDADAAMYVAKLRGPGVVEVFDDADSLRSLDRLSIRSELLHALDRSQLEVHYQPIVELETGRPVAFEALLRWNHPERGPITPDVFIPLAEETGEIVAIGEWVLEHASRQLAAWQRLPGWRNLRLNANLSATQLKQAGVAEHLLSLIRDADIEPADVWLEVTERSQAGVDVTPVTRQLRAGGVHFALDDFGSSYSNLTYLKQFPAEGLKIDRSFVPGAAREGVDRSIVRAILAIAKSLNLDVVAEGIERPAEREALLSLGCRLGQGFLFAPALTAHDATKLLVASTDLAPWPESNAASRLAGLELQPPYWVAASLVQRTAATNSREGARR